MRLHRRLSMQMKPADVAAIARAFRRPPRHMERRRIKLGSRRWTVSVSTDCTGRVCGATLHFSSRDVPALRAWGYDIPSTLAT